MRAAALLGCAVMTAAAVLAARVPESCFSMRCDDNHSPVQWKQVAEAFEAAGFRASFAVNSSSLTAEQGACLKELAARGHEIMDHTGQHAFYSMQFHSAVDCAALTNASFVAAVSPGGKSLLCKSEIDWKHPSLLKFTGAISNGELVVTDRTALKRLHFSAKFYVPSLDRWFGVSRVDGNRRFYLDFWGRRLRDDFAVAETEMLTVPQDAIQPSLGLLRAQARLSRDNFDRFGLPRPTFWIQPGGWESFLSWDRLRAVHGGEFGYHGADAIVGGSQWRGSFNDPDPERGRWTFQSDFGYLDEGNDLPRVKRRLADSLAKNRSFSYISHMNGGRCGGWSEWLRLTREFAAWLKTAGIRVTTHTKLVDAIYAESLPAGTDVFPLLTRDLDGDGLPDGVKLDHGATCDLKTGVVTLDKGQSLCVDGLCGLARGKMELAVQAEGTPEAEVAVQVHQSGRYGGWYAHDNRAFRLDAAGKGRLTLLVEIKPATIGATLSFTTSAKVWLTSVSFSN